MVKQRVVKETRADGVDVYYPERKILGLFWYRYYECWGEWVHCFPTEEAAWYFFESQRKKREEEKAKCDASKIVKREVCK